MVRKAQCWWTKNRKKGTLNLDGLSGTFIGSWSGDHVIVIFLKLGFVGWKRVPAGILVI